MLFNKATNGKEEMKAILGFIYATNSFTNLITDITLAEDEITRLIGKEMFDYLNTWYNSDDYQAEPVEGEDPDPDWAIYDELVHRCQAAIAFLAYHGYATHGDVTHSSTGRQIAVTDTQKPAFEWMIERDNQSMLAKAHKLLDRLLEYLEENKTVTEIAANWATLPVYTLTKGLFINSALEFDRVFPIEESRRFFVKVVPFIKEIERNKILPVLGPVDYETIKGLILTDDISEEAQAIIDLAQVPIALLTMVTAIRRMSVEVLPNGIFQNYVPGTQTIKAKNIPSMDMKASITKVLEDEAAKAMIALQEHQAIRLAVFDGTEYAPQNLTDHNDILNKHFRV